MSYPEKFHSIFARNCEVRRIDKDVAAGFLQKHHLYGDCAAKYRYGIYVRRYSGEENTALTDQDGTATERQHPYPIGTLVAVASFSNGRRWKKSEAEIRSYEWLRYASLPEVRVIGGMGRILSTFVEEVHPDDVMSYAPAEHYEGEVYEKLGFVREGVKSFVKNGVEASSIKFRLKLTDY